MRIHFIAVGGAVMHNLAIALSEKGHVVTGSDDKIYDPARSRLQKAGILPEKMGFFKMRISKKIDAIILGMHAKPDNKELQKAQQLGLPIYSFPEYIYDHAKDMKRVVIAGSHGKTTITSMIMHVLKYWNCEFDFMVGAKLAGFESGVRLSTGAPVMIIEGDEYLASPIEMESKFMYYKPHIALISGIAWDHINVFPTYKEYKNQFKRFAQTIQENGVLVYNTEDTEVRRIAIHLKSSVNKFPYHTPNFTIEDGVTSIVRENGRYPLKVFGAHNLQNLQGARIVCNELGISDDDFYEAIGSFEGADKRLQLLKENNQSVVYRDFAHSPSKLLATTQAVKDQFPERSLVACFELHTFSSFNESFLSEYKDCLSAADIAILFYDPKSAKSKSAGINSVKLKAAFNRVDLLVMTSREKLESYLKALKWEERNLLLMSSGTFDGLDFKVVAEYVVYQKIFENHRDSSDKRTFEPTEE